MLNKVKGFLREVTEVGLVLIALGIVLQILFGSSVAFIGGNIVGNLTGLIGALGSNGLVGLIALAVIIWIYQRRKIK